MIIHYLAENPRETVSSDVERVLGGASSLICSRNIEEFYRNMAESPDRERDGLLLYDFDDIDQLKAILEKYKALYGAVIVKTSTLDVLRDMSDHPRINFFISEDYLTSSCALEKVFGSILGKTSPMGVECFFPDTCMTTKYQVRDPKSKEHIIETIHNEIEKILEPEFGPISQKYAQVSSMVCDELILNAIWDANPRLRQADRSMQFSLDERESIEVKLIQDQGRYGVSVRDPFGTLTRNDVIKHFKLDGIAKKISLRESGGLGLRLSMSSSSELIFIIKPGQYTEVVAVTHVERSVKSFKSRRKSFFYFHSEDEAMS